MEFRVLGPIEVVGNGESFAVGGPKQRAVLALLIADAGRSVSTGSLIEGVYGDSPPQGARRSIQTYVSNLRGVLGDVIVGTNDGYELAVERGVVDALVFEDAVSAARDRDPSEASAVLRDALGLWRGHPYADVDAGDAIDFEIRRLSELRMQALEARIDADLAAGHHRDLIAELESLTVEYPLRERFTHQQMVALYRSGRQAEALRAYERTRTYLVNEIGLDPSAELRDLERRILEQDATLDFEAVSSIRRASVLVADVADPESLSRLPTDERGSLIDSQTAAIEAAADRHGGDVFAQSGTAVYVLFPDASAAASAASDIQHRLDGIEPVGHRLRIAIDVGDVETGDTVTGPPVNRSAAIVSAAHGGQVLLSGRAQHEITEEAGGGWLVRSLGSHDLRGLDEPEVVHQLVIDGLPDRFPDLIAAAGPASLPMTARGLAGYELREEVGSGAFGVVHRGYQPSVGREVAIKVIRPEWANQPDFVRRFEVEAQLVARLEHPHIVPLYDYWREPDAAYLVMRWLRGGTLRDRIATRRLRIDEAHALLADIGPALAFAHRRGVVHRDLRPSNVMFDEEGSAYLTDFGIAGDITTLGHGSVQEDVRALAALLGAAIGETDEPAVDDLIARATSRDDGFDDVRSFIAAWEEAVGAGDSTTQAVGYTPTRNPYKGLSAFSELDAADFHGRDDLVAQLVTSLDERGLVVAVGPSGIGKSSVVKAGLIPALRNGAIDGSDEWLIATMVPGAFPFDELAAALLRVAVKAPSDLEDVLRKDARGLTRAVTRYLPPNGALVLVVDQFEELFTLCDDDDLRRGFIDTLVAATEDSHSRIKLVLTIRADFFDRPLAYGDFGALIQETTVPVTSPTETQLDDIVRLPAQAAGVTFEPGLAERIVAAVKDQPGALPLLEFSLTELFETRDTDTITGSAYDASGGVTAALGRRAEEIYTTLDPARREICREIFLRMVTVNENGRDTRRRVRLTEIHRLDYDLQSTDRVLDAYTAHRLITYDHDPITRGPTVEVAHEAILTQWPRLAAWIEEHREDLLLRSRLAAAVADWETADRTDAYLLIGGRLDQHEAWTADTDLTLTTAEHEYLLASRKAEDDRRSKRRRTRRLVMSGFGVVAVLAVLLAGAALVARSDAQNQTSIASQQAALAQLNADEASRNEDRALQSELLAQESAAEAEGRTLLASSAAVLDEDPDLALLLALEGANALDSDKRSIASLRRALNASRTLYAGASPADRPSRWATGDLSPDGQVVAASGGIGNYFEVTNIDTDTVVWSHEFDADIPGELEISLQFFDQGSKLLAAVLWVPALEREFDEAPPGAGLFVFDAGTGDLISELESGRCGAALVSRGFSQPFQANETSDNFALISTYSESFGGCGLGSAPPLSDVLLVDLRTGVETVLVSEWSAIDGPLPFALSKDASTSVSLELPDFDVVVVDLATGSALMSTPSRAGALSFALSDDGSVLAIGNGSAVRNIETFDTATGELLVRMAGHSGDVTGMTFTSDNTRLITAGADGSVRIWDLETGLEIDSIRGSKSPTTDIRVSNDGERLVVFNQTDSWRVVSLTGSELREGASLVSCEGAPVTFNLRGGVRVTSERTLVYAWCGESRVAYLWDRDSGDVEGSDLWDGQSAALSADGRFFAGAPLILDDPTTPIVGPYGIYDTSTGDLIVELEGVCKETNAETGRPVSEECDLIPEFPVVDLDDALPIGFSAFDLEFSSSGDLIGGADWTSTGMVWNATTGAALVLVPGASLAFSPSGDSVVFFAEQDAALNLYETESFELIATHEFGTKESSGQYLVFSPDGTIVVGTPPDGSGSSDVVVFDAATLEELRRIENPHEGGTRDIAISDDGKMIATGGTEGTVRIWDIETLALIQDLPISEDRIQSVNFADDDTKLVVATPGGPVVEILLAPEALVDHARSRITRGFTSAECAEYFPGAACPSVAELRGD